jgi:hypothetical protein
MKNVIGITEDKLHPKAEDVFENKDVILLLLCSADNLINF